MARRHGWQLPAHSFQVVAIIVFILLSVGFYVFLAPFLGNDIYQYIATGIYSLLAFCVSILYVRCTAIDPADSGIFIETADKISANKSPNSSTTEEPSKVELKNGGRYFRQEKGSCSEVGGCLCSFLVNEDCHKNEDHVEEQDEEDSDSYFCTLCNAEVGKFSKHCRSCDKCVDGFDHHCRWVNNCVGRKNYITFMCLMATSLVWLVFEGAVGTTVLVRCFINRKATENQIIHRLGDGFSRPPFATIVALCTTVSIVAIITLGELFFFHVILIRKGITTYEYIVAVRNQSEAPGASLEGDEQSLASSPTSSATTGVSRKSSVGKGDWCTPPRRLFMDHQDEIVNHLESGPDSVESDKAKRASVPVRISAWKLAKLDSNEAIKAGVRARASSSVLRPISSSRPHNLHDHYSSGTIPATTNISQKNSKSNATTKRSQASREDSDWDLEASRLVPSKSVGSSSLFGSPIVKDMRSGRSLSIGAQTSYYQQKKGRGELPIFVPRDTKQNQCTRN